MEKQKYSVTKVEETIFSIGLLLVIVFLFGIVGYIENDLPEEVEPKYMEEVPALFFNR